ncbi:HEPN domain protein [Methanobrevibacter curvatus]|uniref:HEPN domain protein n=2 Tax=Methanobrevibacter curvatus TaxID=49547 RepID=A0A166B034_9EURY|nr:HEPN domain protein [Methanobrevibacter curvatus]
MEQYETSINRSYYAVFHVANALLVKKGIRTKTHSGTISEFGKQYVNLDNFEKEIFNIFPNLEEIREDVDYDVFNTVNEIKADKSLEKAEIFIGECRRFL